MAGTATYGNVTEPADNRVFTLHLMDASGDTWTERLVVALGATFTAIQAWIALYQAVTQASIFQVDEVFEWVGDADPDNANFLARSGVENGVNLSFREPDLGDTRLLRVVAPVADVMQGTQDIPLLTGGSMDELIVATVALQPGYNLRSAQYTSRRERKNNAKVK